VKEGLLALNLGLNVASVDLIELGLLELRRTLAANLEDMELVPSIYLQDVPENTELFVLRMASLWAVDLDAWPGNSDVSRVFVL
jgi:hypothetical protein